MASTKKKTIDEIAARLVLQPNGCLIWPGARGGRGNNQYGTVKYRQRQYRVHKLLYEHYVGPVPEGLVLDHFVCDTKLCGNWLHVRPVTHKQNMERVPKEKRRNHHTGQTHCKRGHEFTPDNTYVDKGGGRQCRSCQRARQTREYWEGRTRVKTAASHVQRLISLGFDHWHHLYVVDGLNLYVLGERYGVSHGTIRNILLALNIARRSGGTPRRDDGSK